MVRLQRYLASCGIASRRQAEGLIAAGRVVVNGNTAKLGDSIDPGNDRVTIDGRPILPQEKVYILLNKPRGVVTSARDTHGRKTVLDCLADVNARVFPVGRLDMDVTGILLLTNDGELAHRLTHPSFQVQKIYVARVRGLVEPAQARALAEGVRLEDGPTAPADVEIREAGARGSVMQIGIHEGRKRQVKRMCAAVGHPVEELSRVSFCGLSAEGLSPGEWRRLSPDETACLKAAVGLPTRLPESGQL